MNDLDYGKKPIHILCAALIITGICLIWHYLRKGRFYPPEEHWGLRGHYWSGGWITLVQGIVMAVLGFVILFMFG